MDARQIFSYQDWRAEPPLYDLTGGVYCISATMLQSVYTLARGPWAVQYEQRYQRVRQAIEGHRAAIVSQPEAGRPGGAEYVAWRQLVKEFEQLRLARLSAYLRRRVPDDQVGYSILIFRLTDAEVRRALDGPPAELLPQPEIEGVTFGGS